VASDFESTLGVASSAVDEGLANSLLAPCDPPPEVGLAAGEHPHIQLAERRDIWDRHQMTATKTPDLSLNAALFVGALDTRSRELRLIEIVRAQRDEPV